MFDESEMDWKPHNLRIPINLGHIVQAHETGNRVLMGSLTQAE